MHLYLSSYRLGDKTEELVNLFSSNKKIGYVPNALDYSKYDQDRATAGKKEFMDQLQGIGLVPEMLDLRDYFGKPELLKEKLASLGGVWVTGGNVFVLRQAMQLSGFDALALELVKRKDFVYAGHSAGCCVLSPSLKNYMIVDDATDTPYEELSEVLSSGIGLLDFVFVPHYKSDHPESADVDKEVQKCIEDKVLFRAFRDGEVLIFELS